MNSTNNDSRASSASNSSPNRSHSRARDDDVPKPPQEQTTTAPSEPAANNNNNNPSDPAQSAMDEPFHHYMCYPLRIIEVDGKQIEQALAMAPRRWLSLVEHENPCADTIPAYGDAEEDAVLGAEDVDEDDAVAGAAAADGAAEAAATGGTDATAGQEGSAMDEMD